jgi:hypothetical protein
LTEGTIQTLYNNISNTAKIHCSSTFNSTTRELRWLYNDTQTYDGILFRQVYNRELIYDSLLKAFYTNTIAHTNPMVSGYVETTLYKSELNIQDISVSPDLVVVGSDQVQTSSLISIGDKVKTKYLTLVDNGTIFGTISEFKSDLFLDWYSFNSVGQNYTSYLITGYEVVGDPSLIKQAPYLTTYFNRTEDGFDANNNALHPSSCLIQARWNYSDHANSGQWGKVFQAYRLLRNYIITGASTSFDYGYNTVITKNKLRGSGHALSILFTSERGMDLHIYGWTISFAGRSNV